jgi:hypothetical protein
MSHSPGPWKRKDWSSGGVLNSEGRFIAAAYTPDDARLIAAAPDLLEALEQTVLHMQATADLAINTYGEVGGKWQKAIDDANSAIAKAKGNQS